MRLGLPADTEGFEFVAVGRRPALRANVEYTATARVRWPGGPAAAPAGADATSGDPSAIVSFWARHRDAAGDYAGRDVWLFDHHWTELTFRFRATDPGAPTLVYLSLLPNQTPRATEILADDFTLTARPAGAPAADRRPEAAPGGGFDAAPVGALADGPVGGGWRFAGVGGDGVNGAVAAEGEAEGGNRFVRLAMGAGTSNFASARLWRAVELKAGVRYAVACRLRRDGYADGDENRDGPGGPPIVNFGMYHPASDTWYGPVDQALRPSGDWETYAFDHVPPRGGAWELYVQLNGWGNFGRPLTVSADDFSCRPAGPGSPRR